MLIYKITNKINNKIYIGKKYKYVVNTVLSSINNRESVTTIPKRK